MSPVTRGLVGALTALALAMVASVAAALPVPLTLINGWTNAPFNTSVAEVGIVNGIVYLKGGIKTAGTNPHPFILPAGYRPAAKVLIPIDIGSAKKGELLIDTAGNVTVRAEANLGSFSQAQSFTSLDGASFALNANGFIPLTLENGWQAATGSAKPAVRVINNTYDVVHLEGGMTNPSGGGTAFVLPVGYRPATTVYIPVDLCGAGNGRLLITPDGGAFVETRAHQSARALCFTSLDGASFARIPAGTDPIMLMNGWSGAHYSTSAPAVGSASGVVVFKGSMSGGSNAQPFVLIPAYRPSKVVILPVDMCDTTDGRMVIQPSGVVTVQAEQSFGNAQCFTSLDGVWFLNDNSS